jgi:hypothetical protein
LHIFNIPIQTNSISLLLLSAKANSLAKAFYFVSNFSKEFFRSLLKHSDELLIGFYLEPIHSLNGQAFICEKKKTFYFLLACNPIIPSRRYKSYQSRNKVQNT